jgi:hypothetical protein
VPADVEDFLSVEGEAGEALDVSFRVMRCPRWGELPVEEVAGDDGVLVAFEVGLVVYREIMSGNVDGGLMRARLA